MDIQALKIELVKEIVSSESKELLDKIYTALKGNKADFWLELTTDEQEEVRISREQIKNGNTEDWTDIYERLARKSA
jgi:hypothetical protein